VSERGSSGSSRERPVLIELRLTFTSRLKALVKPKGPDKNLSIFSTQPATAQRGPVLGDSSKLSILISIHSRNSWSHLLVTGFSPGYAAM